MKKRTQFVLLSMIVIFAATSFTPLSGAEEIKLSDLNGTIVETTRVASLQPPRISNDGDYWILTVYFKSAGQPLSIKFRYPAGSQPAAQNDYRKIRSRLN